MANRFLNGIPFDNLELVTEVLLSLEDDFVSEQAALGWKRLLNAKPLEERYILPEITNFDSSSSEDTYSEETEQEEEK